ncbi:MAG: nodulation protein NfeD [Candidatus Marinimicrobia bacterium]|jgi:membrane-bound serine protease (ClpP class)|nr:nodulation protein NfeD [Candidatus Neomarinimicrobiota bacterium]MBT3896065.1 nodulation protein NfeD [Candidatus Neomarinimicrobiota bacterium]MBT4537486.1 nodulation protein NfeD [Candidatus Neomarinimicrobiota bacterium]MBT4851967.1 nodulation protein NfeD [Candidatus Neomarinimicrobiota bacterium]MBT5538226.1 nodulation protein NfeD [Candidatus Neomarinimicrobiota bacterium]
MKYQRLFFIILFSIIIPQEGKIFSIPIQGDIDMGLPFYIERGIDQAEKEGADFILFEIDTFGGRLDAATRIKDAILDTKIPTVAFINRRAISAGALISLSCDSIFIASGGTIGAATAVDQSGKKASEKVISYMREEMASTAEANNRNRDVAAAMVDEDIEIPFAIDTKKDTLFAIEISGFKSGKLVTLSTLQALRLGIADGEYDSRSDLLHHLYPGEYILVTVDESWSEKMVRFLTSPTVAPLLMTLGMVGLFFEIKSPGFGFPGLFGLLCLALFFGSHLLVGLADVFELILLFSGLTLIFLEVFVIPGFGVTGISGIILVLYSMYKMLLSPHPGPGEAWDAIYGLNIGIIVMFISCFVLFRALTKSNFYKKIVPVEGQKKSEGYSISKGYEKLIGLSGKAITDLRPTGKALILGKEYQVMTHGEYIIKNTEVIVDGVDENQVLVKSLT